MTNHLRPWMDKYDKEVLPKLNPPLIAPVHTLLDNSAAEHPDRIAVHFNNWIVNYAKLKSLTEIAAANLKALGVEPGDKVAVMLPNLPQTIIAYWAVLRAGATAVMTNPLYMETELTHQFNDSGTKLLITLDLLWPKLEKVIPKTKIEKCIVVPASDSPPFLHYNESSVLPWNILAHGNQTFTHSDIDPEKDIAILQYTGGTTGLSKGCMLTHGNLTVNAQQSSQMLWELGQKEQECFLGVMPFFHIYGITVCLNFNTLLAAKLIPFSRFVPQEVLEGISKHRPTIFPGAPSIYIALLQQKKVADYNLKSIKFCISGSAPMPVEYIEKFQQVTGAIICEGYGLTEASPVTHINPARGIRKPGSIGIPLPGTDAKIVDDELCIRGPQVMQGYYNQPEETSAVLRDHWLYTGDIAKIDEDGYFYIFDRKKDMIINGGFNVFPREIDEVLHTHPKIAEAVAVGIPNKNRGETIKAFVVLNEGETMECTEVIAYCREKLASYKVPRKVEFRDELPKNMVGKVLRRALREE